MATTIRKFKIPYRAHSGQRIVHRSDARYIVLANGRRWGKTLLAVIEAFRRASSAANRISWWVAPTYDLTQRGWDLWSRIVPQPLYEAHKAERYIQLHNGSRIYFKSADKPERLIGEGLHDVIVDEAARVSPVAWQQSLLPCLLDYGGRALLISTPRSRNWFYDEFKKGRSADWPDYESHSASSFQNHHLDRGFLDNLRVSTPDEIWRQEIMAEFIEGGGMVFRMLFDCIEDGDWFPKLKPDAGKIYLAGVDLAKKADSTVCVTLEIDRSSDAPPRLVDLQRWKDMPWPHQSQRITDLRKRWGWSETVVDATGIGDAIVDELRHIHGIPVRAVQFTNQSKAQMVNELRLAFEQQSIILPPVKATRDTEVLFDELEAYESDITASGNLTYGHPDGGHDDTVSALMLAVSRAPYAGAAMGAVI